MPLNRIEHFLVLSDDIDATRDFYRDALGMSVGPRPPLGFPGYWLYLGDVPCLHIGDWDAYRSHSAQRGMTVSARAAGTGPVDHIAFNATGFDDIASKLRQHGVEFRLNTVPGIGLRQLFLTDPNGVRIEINVPA